MKKTDDPFHLGRFVAAQNRVIDAVVAELTAGHKRSHWMWFIFPQVKGLGASPTAQHFAIASRAEAKAYLAHPVLGPRLLRCTALVNQIDGRSIEQIFGTPDDLKFRSSMTLFANAADDRAAFEAALRKFFAGKPDTRTLELLQAGSAF